MRSNSFFSMVTVVLLLGAAAAHPNSDSMTQMNRVWVRWSEQPVEIDVSAGSGPVDRHARTVIAGDIRPALEKFKSQVGAVEEEVKGIREDVDALKAVPEPEKLTNPTTPPAGLATISEPDQSTTEPSAPVTETEEKGGAKMSPWSIFGMIMIVVVVVAGGIVAIIVSNSRCAENRRNAAADRAQQGREGAAGANHLQRVAATFPPLPPFKGGLVGRMVRYYENAEGRNMGFDDLSTTDYGEQPAASPQAFPNATPRSRPVLRTTDPAAIVLQPPPGPTDPNSDISATDI